jgi:hypothetical protein
VTVPKLNTTDYTRTQTKAPTCTATGTYTWKWKTTTYGTFSYTTSIAATGHLNFGKVSTGARMEVSCTDCGKKFSASMDDVHVVVVNAYWKDGKLYAQSLVMNARGSVASSINVKKLEISNQSGLVAAGEFGTIDSMILLGYSYKTHTFVFSGDAIKQMNADMSSFTWKFSVGYN